MSWLKAWLKSIFVALFVFIPALITGYLTGEGVLILCSASFGMAVTALTYCYHLEANKVDKHRPYDSNASERKTV